MCPLMLHSLAPVADLHPPAPDQQPINVNTTYNSGLSFTHSLNRQPIHRFFGYSDYFRTSRAKLALFAAGRANVTHVADAGAPRCCAPMQTGRQGVVVAPPFSLWRKELYLGSGEASGA